MYKKWVVSILRLKISYIIHILNTLNIELGKDDVETEFDGSLSRRAEQFGCVTCMVCIVCAVRIVCVVCVNCAVCGLYGSCVLWVEFGWSTPFSALFVRKSWVYSVVEVCS